MRGAGLFIAVTMGLAALFGSGANAAAKPLAQPDGSAAPLGRTMIVEGPAAIQDSVLLTESSNSNAWSAVANAAWLSVNAGSASGTGSTNVFFSIDANSGATRTGTLTIAGKTVTIIQAGSTYVADSQPTVINTEPLGYPRGAAVDRSGNVYIPVYFSEGGGIEEYSPVTKSFTLLFTTGLPADLVAVDGSGNVYSDNGTKGIVEYSAATKSVTPVISLNLDQATGLAVDGSGNVYYGDSGNDAIKVYSPVTKAVTTLVYPVVSSAGGPGQVAVDGSGNVFFIALYGFDEGDVQEYSPSTQAVTTLPIPGITEPQALALDGSGNVYVAGYLDNAITEYSPSTQAVTTVVSGIYDVGGMAVDGSGNVYIADTGNNWFDEYSPGTQSFTVLALGNVDAGGLALDGSGNIYFSDADQAYSVNSNALYQYSTATGMANRLISAGVSNAGGVALDGLGDVYLASSGSNSILDYSFANEAGGTLVSTGLNDPTGLAADGAGDVYIADTGNRAVEECPGGTDSLTALVSTGLSEPTGVAADQNRNVYIADSGSDTIKEYSAATRTVSTLVSSGLGDPAGVAVDGGGNVFIADAGTSTFDTSAIKVYSPAARAVSTLASGLPVITCLAVDGSGNIFINNQQLQIDEMPRAFVDPSTRSEPDSSGTDALPPVVPATVSLSGPFAPTSDQSWLTIGPIENGVVNFSFTANSGGVRTAHIGVLGQSITIKQGLNSPRISVQQPAGTPLSSGGSVVSFGSVPVANAAFNQLTFTISNAGSTALTSLALSVTGGDAGDFLPGAPGSTVLASGSSTTFSVVFNPSATGARDATLRVASNDPVTPIFTIGLTGTGTGAPESFKVKTSSSPAAGGSTKGGGSFTSGAEATVVAKPGGGYQFVDWTQGEAVVSTSASYLFPVTANVALVANFARVTYAITPSAGANGAISPSTVQTVARGGHITCTATRGTGYKVAQWLVNGAPAKTVGDAYELKNVTANDAVEVTFAQLPPVITSALVASGTIGEGFTYQVAATNTPTLYTSGSLPAGLVLDASTGAISGTPALSGSFAVTLGAINGSGTGSAVVSVLIGDVPGFHEIDLAPYSNEPIATAITTIPPPPSGNVTLGNIPFVISQETESGKNIWSGDAAAPGSGRATLDVPVNLANVSEIHLLMNTFWGKPKVLAHIKLVFQSGTYTRDLLGNSDIRDYENWVFTNKINNVTSVMVFSGSSTLEHVPGRIDKMVIPVPPQFQSQRLLDVEAVDDGARYVQRLLVMGLTVRVGPVPSLIEAQASPANAGAGASGKSAVSEAVEPAAAQRHRAAGFAGGP